MAPRRARSRAAAPHSSRVREQSLPLAAHFQKDQTVWPCPVRLPRFKAKRKRRRGGSRIGTITSSRVPPLYVATSLAIALICNTLWPFAVLGGVISQAVKMLFPAIADYALCRRTAQPFCTARIFRSLRQTQSCPAVRRFRLPSSV